MLISFIVILLIDYPSPIAYNGNIHTTKGITTMSYGKKAKARMMKYMQSKRESLRLNLPLGTKDGWKDYTADYGMSVTELITKLIERRI